MSATTRAPVPTTFRDLAAFVLRHGFTLDAIDQLAELIARVEDQTEIIRTVVPYAIH